MPRDKRRLVLRDWANEIIQRERITITVARAKESKRVVERVITLAKRGVESGVDSQVEAAKRKVYNRLQRELAVAKVFDVLVERYRNRPGGYTRIVRIGPRSGDGAEMAIIELVKDEEKPKADEPEKKGRKERKIQSKVKKKVKKT